MITPARRAPDSPRSAPAAPAGSGPLTGSRVQLRLSRPGPRSIVIHVSGALDDVTTSRLREILDPQLSSVAETVVLDLSELRFLGVAGLELLARARRRAGRRGIEIRVVDGPVCVDRALRAAGEGETVRKFATVEAALSDSELPAPTSGNLARALG